MKASLVSLLCSSFFCLHLVAGHAAKLLRLVPPLKLIDLEANAGSNGSGLFTQPIDHQNPSVGNFTQRFWYNTTFYGGPGYPVVMFTPGETSAEKYAPYMTERALPGMYAKANKAAVVIVEHRYWGDSSPYKIQNASTLEYHTLQNAVADLVNFARNVKLPFDKDSKSNAPKAPWVFVGGSYSGALAAWTAKIAPGTYWAYSASSAPVQAIDDFWQYFEPIREGMPKNCSSAFIDMIKSVDKTLLSGNRTAIESLKTSFGLEGLKHDDDFASALSIPLGEWQYTSFTTGHDTFFQMCDAIQGGKGTSSLAAEMALTNFANWFKNKYLPTYCFENYKYSEYRPRSSIGCFESYNASAVIFTDQSSGNNFDRPWYWMLCNEPFAYWQTGAPSTETTLVSRLVTPQYFRRQCDLFFPGGNFTLAKREERGTVDKLNELTKGWLLSETQRLLWVNGEFDPWRAASVSSKFRPGGPMESTKNVPVFLVKNGSHCTDFSASSAAANPELKKQQTAIIAQMKDWVDEFYTINGKPSSGTPRIRRSFQELPNGMSRHGRLERHGSITG